MTNLVGDLFLLKPLHPMDEFTQTLQLPNRYHHSNVYNEDLTSLDTIPCRSICHARIFILGKTTLISIWFRMVSTQAITWVYKSFTHLEIPTIFQHLTNITILIPMSRLFGAINIGFKYIQILDNFNSQYGGW